MCVSVRLSVCLSVGLGLVALVIDVVDVLNPDTHFTSSDDDVELLAVDSPLRMSTNPGQRSRRLGGVLRLRRSDDDLRNDEVSDDDALMSLERELTRGGGTASGRGGADSEGCNLSLWLQQVMYHGVAVPVLKARWPIIGELCTCSTGLSVKVKR